MNFATIIAAGICRIRGHDFGRWATKQAATGGPYGERTCKRCGKTEIGAAPKPRKRRGRTEADTVTPEMKA